MASPFSSIITLDCQYVLPRFAASFLLIERQALERPEAQSAAVFIETNTARAVPILLDGLKEQGLTPAQVQYVIVTHAHLDHAGGASALLKACPNAVVLAHPKTVPHLLDPSRLIASARQVYGDAVFDQLYGEIEPIAASRVRAVQDGQEIEVGWRGGAEGAKTVEGAQGGRRLRFLETRGHAQHHICVQDLSLKAIFTGDSFGLAYPDVQKKGLFIFPSTSPTGFEPEEAQKSINRIVGSGATRAFLTHFGEVAEMGAAATQLKADLDFSAKLMEEAASSELEDSALNSFCEEKLLSYFQGRLARLGLADDSSVWEILKLDFNLNAAGIAFAAKRKRSKK